MACLNEFRFPDIFLPGSLLLQTTSACRARFEGEGILFRPEWLCVSDSSPIRYCVYDEGAPLIVGQPGGRVQPALIAIYGGFFDFEQSPPVRDCSFQSQQLSIMISARNFYPWLNGVAGLSEDGVLGDAIFSGGQQGEWASFRISSL